MMDFTDLDKLEQLMTDYLTLTDKQYRFIIENSHHTGSRVLGGSHKISDWDYVMLEKDYLSNFNQVYNQYDDVFGTSSVKYIYKYKIINILVAKEQIHFNAWVFATEEYLRLTNSKIMDKNIRVKLFSSLREVYLTLNS